MLFCLKVSFGPKKKNTKKKNLGLLRDRENAAGEALLKAGFVSDKIRFVGKGF